jgi:hypothetical protein
MTTANDINHATLLSMFLTHQSSLSTRKQYDLNTYHITALFGAYLYCKYVEETFTIHTLEQMIRSYNHNRLKKYINRLEEVKLIDKVSISPYNRYIITQRGVDAINTISNKLDSLIYSFCNSHNIEL